MVAPERPLPPAATDYAHPPSSIQDTLHVLTCVTPLDYFAFCIRSVFQCIVCAHLCSSSHVHLLRCL